MGFTDHSEPLALDFDMPRPLCILYCENPLLFLFRFIDYIWRQSDSTLQGF